MVKTHTTPKQYIKQNIYNIVIVVVLWHCLILFDKLKINKKIYIYICVFVYFNKYICQGPLPYLKET